MSRYRNGIIISAENSEENERKKAKTASDVENGGVAIS